MVDILLEMVQLIILFSCSQKNNYLLEVDNQTNEPCQCLYIRKISHIIGLKFKRYQIYDAHDIFGPIFFQNKPNMNYLSKLEGNPHQPYNLFASTLSGR